MPASINGMDIKKRRKEIAERLRIARVVHGWTQEQTAQFLGCSRLRLNRIERGTAELTLIEADALASLFQVPLTFFTSDEQVQIA